MRQFSSLRVLVNKESDVINTDLRKWNMHQRHVAHAKLQKDYTTSLVLKMSTKWIQRRYIMTNERTLPPRIVPDGLPEEGFYCHSNQ